MGFRIKSEEMLIIDFVRFSILRHIARHKCKCGENQIPLAMEVSKVFGGENSVGKKHMIEPWKRVMVKARNRQITKAGIAQVPSRILATKYSLGIATIRDIIDKGLNKVFRIGNLPPPR